MNNINTIINLKNYGYTNFYERQVEQLKVLEEGLIPARVTAVHKEQYKIVTEQGEKAAKLKGSLFYNDEINNIYPTVGDFVLVKPNPYGDDVIYKVLDRASKFSRLDSWNEIEQVVAANFDYVFIMASLNHDFNIKRIERYLTAAWQSGGTPVIILTKRDVCEDYMRQKEKVEQIAPGVAVVALSSYTGEGMGELEAFVKPGKTVVFLGSSGVGKSTLVNAIAGEEIMKVNDIRETDSKGRHTTTHRQLIVLNSGTMIIDTPGMRELGMWDVTESLDTTFFEIEEFSSKCKFRDCRHEAEPGCAVRAALESGELSKDRWDNYIKLKKEAKFAEAKESLNARMKEKTRQKGFAKFKRELYKGRA